MTSRNYPSTLCSIDEVIRTQGEIDYDKFRASLERLQEQREIILSLIERRLGSTAHAEPPFWLLPAKIGRAITSAVRMRTPIAMGSARNSKKSPRAEIKP